MIDVNDLNKLDCACAKNAVERTYKCYEISDSPYQEDVDFLREFVKEVEALQRKYTKPVAALLKRDVNG